MPYYKNKRWYVSISFKRKADALAFEEANKDLNRLTEEAFTESPEYLKLRSKYLFCDETLALLKKHPWKMNSREYIYRYVKIGKDYKVYYFHREACGLELFGSGQASVKFHNGDKKDLRMVNMWVQMSDQPRISKKHKEIIEEFQSEQREELLSEVGVKTKEEKKADVLEEFGITLEYD